MLMTINFVIYVCIVDAAIPVGSKWDFNDGQVLQNIFFHVVKFFVVVNRRFYFFPSCCGNMLQFLEIYDIGSCAWRHGGRDWIISSLSAGSQIFWSNSNKIRDQWWVFSCDVGTFFYDIYSLITSKGPNFFFGDTFTTSIGGMVPPVFACFCHFSCQFL